MLVLSRKQDQEILIGDQIKITILKTRGNTVRLGIEAPRDIKVVRGELKPEPVAGSDTEEDSAEFTIVFGQPDSVAEFDSPDDAGIVQFDSNSRGLSASNRNRLIDKTNQGQSQETIRFQGQLPKVLQHNRLKDIVNRIAADGKVAQAAE